VLELEHAVLELEHVVNRSGSALVIHSQHHSPAFNNNNNNNNNQQPSVSKVDKYSALERTHFFQPIAVESLGAMNRSAHLFLNELGQKISAVSGEQRDGSYLLLTN